MCPPAASDDPRTYLFIGAAQTSVGRAERRSRLAQGVDLSPSDPRLFELGAAMGGGLAGCGGGVAGGAEYSGGRLETRCGPSAARASRRGCGRRSAGAAGHGGLRARECSGRLWRASMRDAIDRSWRSGRCWPRSRTPGRRRRPWRRRACWPRGLSAAVQQMRGARAAGRRRADAVGRTRSPWRWTSRAGRDRLCRARRGRRFERLRGGRAGAASGVPVRPEAARNLVWRWRLGARRRMRRRRTGRPGPSRRATRRPTTCRQPARRDGEIDGRSNGSAWRRVLVDVRRPRDRAAVLVSAGRRSRPSLSPTRRSRSPDVRRVRSACGGAAGAERGPRRGGPGAVERGSGDRRPRRARGFCWRWRPCRSRWDARQAAGLAPTTRIR